MRNFWFKCILTKSLWNKVVIFYCKYSIRKNKFSKGFYWRSTFWTNYFINFVASLFPKPVYNRVVGLIIHEIVSWQDPEHLVVGSWHNWISVIIGVSQLNDPILSFSIFHKRIEDNLQLWVRFIFNQTFTKWTTPFSIFYARILNLDSLLINQSVKRLRIDTISLKDDRDQSLLVPPTNISFRINIVNSLGRIRINMILNDLRKEFNWVSYKNQS